jgi:hypothetical protein
MLDEYRELLLHRTITQQPNKLVEAVTLVTCFLDVRSSNLDRRRHGSDCMCGFSSVHPETSGVEPHIGS